MIEAREDSSEIHFAAAPPPAPRKPEPYNRRKPAEASSLQTADKVRAAIVFSLLAILLLVALWATTQLDT